MNMNDSDEGEVFLDKDDIIHEISIDEEELPDWDDEEIDFDVCVEADDSFYVFKGHTDELYSVACSPIDASLVATGGKDDRGFMWKVGSQYSSLELQVLLGLAICTVYNTCCGAHRSTLSNESHGHTGFASSVGILFNIRCCSALGPSLFASDFVPAGSQVAPGALREGNNISYLSYSSS
ncbi:hypothetical protein KFK09_002504 [Dendrobium nobile]|uniref:Uncharacterized protein n=1 Tax=Dendrobium nobile TaxID=94219 RepID=A0A8T3C1K1_DENNO|nr:hypothetical protein KFK09_002504 [Dendrobium nobile]